MPYPDPAKTKCRKPGDAQIRAVVKLLCERGVYFYIDGRVSGSDDLQADDVVAFVHDPDKYWKDRGQDSNESTD